jgi:heat shock protein HtpX
VERCPVCNHEGIGLFCASCGTRRGGDEQRSAAATPGQGAATRAPDPVDIPNAGAPEGTAAVGWTRARARRRSRLVVAGSYLYLWLLSNALLYDTHRSIDCDTYRASEFCVGWQFNPTVPLVSAVILSAGLVALWKLAPKIAVAGLHPKPTDEPCFRQLRNIVESAAVAAGIDPPAVYVTDAASINAAVVATSRDSYAVVVTIGALEQLSRRELSGLVANRIAAATSGDVAVLTAAVTVANGLNTAADATMYYTAQAARHVHGKNGAILLVPFLFGLFLKLVAYPQALLVRAALSKSRHERADAVALDLTREPAGLRGALEKMETSGTDLPYPTRSTAVLWAASPERPTKRRWGASLRRLVATHGPLADRIAMVRGVERLDRGGRGPVDRTPRRVDYRAALHSDATYPVLLRRFAGGRLYLGALIFVSVLVAMLAANPNTLLAPSLEHRLSRAAVAVGCIVIFFGMLRPLFRHNRVMVHADRLELQPFFTTKMRDVPASSIAGFAVSQQHVQGELVTFLVLFADGTLTRRTKHFAKLAKLHPDTVAGRTLVGLVPLGDDNEAKFMYSWCAHNGIGLLTDDGVQRISPAPNYFVATPVNRIERFVNHLPLPLVAIGTALILAGWWGHILSS